MRRLEGKVVIVTGGGSGIGRGAALRIAEEGGSFVVTSSIAGSVVGAGGAAASYAVSKLSLIHI